MSVSKTKLLVMIGLGLFLFGSCKESSTPRVQTDGEELRQAFALYGYALQLTPENLFSWRLKLENISGGATLKAAIEPKRHFSPSLILAHGDTTFLFALLQETFMLTNRQIDQLRQSQNARSLKWLNKAAFELARISILATFEPERQADLRKQIRPLNSFMIPLLANGRPDARFLSHRWLTLQKIFNGLTAQHLATGLNSGKAGFVWAWLITGVLLFITALLVLKVLQYRRGMEQLLKGIRKFIPQAEQPLPPRKKRFYDTRDRIIEAFRQLRQNQVETEQKLLTAAGRSRLFEQKLGEIENTLQAVLSLQEFLWEKASVALALIDDKRRFIRVNQTFCKLARLTEAELLGRPYSSIFQADGKLHAEKMLFQNNNGSAKDGLKAEKHILWCGQKVWWKTNIFSISDSGDEAKLIMIDDVTHWLKQIHELSQKAKHFKLLFNQTNDPVFVNQLTREQRFGPFVEVNKKAIETYLYSREEFKYLNPLTLIPAEHRAKHEEITQKLVKDGHVIYEIEYFRKDKRRIPVEINAHLFDYRDQPMILSIVRDVSERKRAQQSLKKFGLQLRNLASRLQDIREEERSMIAREIHDELGQLLTVLKIEISLLCKRFEIDNPQVKTKVGTISDLINQAVQTIQQITAKLRPSILDEVGLIAALEWQAEEFSKHTGIPCKTHFPQEEIELDRERATALFRIFQESLTNIARHAQAKRISVFLKISPQKVILEVIDNGLGINRQQIESPQSLGILGMRERAMVFGGHLEIHGVPGQGTRVKVELPLGEQ
ncbi:PAS domain-containing sensor histidine kinase [Calditrichota bacterium GD2]